LKKNEEELHKDVYNYEIEKDINGIYPIGFWFPIEKGKSAKLRWKPPGGKRGKEPEVQETSVEASEIVIFDSIHMVHATHPYKPEEGDVPSIRLNIMIYGDQVLANAKNPEMLV